MKVDIRGRVRNTKLPFRNCLQPLFEAVINSIHAIQESPAPAGGRITISIVREDQQELAEETLPPVDGFVIHDNGAGFTDRNFDSFQTSDSTLKMNLGGKGVGRLSWLKAFESASVESTFQSDGTAVRRRFDFRSTADGVENHSVQPVDEAAGSGTQVTLRGFRQRYKNECPKRVETIARRTVEHCLEYYLLGDFDFDIVVVDEVTDTSVHLSQVFSEEFEAHTQFSSVLLPSGEALRIQHVLVRSPHDYGHQVHFCAHHRVVKSAGLSARVPHLDAALYDQDGKAFAYSGYISGPLLDDRVESDRTDFRIPNHPTPLTGSDTNWQDIWNHVADAARDFLGPFTAGSRQASRDRVRAYVQDEAPRYRYLLTRKAEQIQDFASSAMAGLAHQRRAHRHTARVFDMPGRPG